MFMKRNLMKITIMTSEMGHVSLVFECTRVPIFIQLHGAIVDRVVGIPIYGSLVGGGTLFRRVLGYFLC